MVPTTSTSCLLASAGKISHGIAIAKAELECDRFASKRAALPSVVEKHFEEAVREVQKMKKNRPAKKRTS